MQFHNTCIESFGYCVPDEEVTSDALERRLQPLYDRLKLPEGRLELMTGIRSRRVWDPGTLPSDKSIESARLAIQAAGIDPHAIGILIHGSVCRDHLEPATACRVHHELGLAPECVIFDVSNACLGLLTGMLQIANMIELGQVRAGLVVGTEDSRHLMETTVETLNHDPSLTRRALKLAVASLTIGSGSCAIVLTDESLSQTKNRLLGGAVRAHTAFHGLCQSGRDEAVAAGMQPLMQTDSESLMREGIATGAATFESLLTELDWCRDDIDRTFCHQVGATHRKLMLESLQLNPARDFPTVEWLGNTGSVALPMTMALGCQAGRVARGERLALLGIGSGINCVMLGAQWQETRVAGVSPIEIPANSIADSISSQP